MEELKLVIAWKDFSYRINEQIHLIDSILQKEGAIKTEEDFDALKVDIKRWEESTYSILIDSFNRPSNMYASSFKNTRTLRLNSQNKPIDIYSEVKKMFAGLRLKKRDLISTEALLSVCDYTVNLNQNSYPKRQKFNTTQKVDFALDKLYDLYLKLGDYSYPIKIIMDGNGIKLGVNEDRSIGIHLQELGLVDVSNETMGFSAQINMNGKILVEYGREKYTEDFSDLNKSQGDINSSIDEIKSELHKLGFGQEIIFNELEELKELYSVLKPKTWAQTLKGKLIDFVASQVLDKEVVIEIYKALTDHNLKLPS